jgi:Ca2+/Na+ antiporter
MITIIGFTIGVPDTVMGLSFLAVGTSVPEVFSSLIVCRQGKVCTRSDYTVDVVNIIRKIRSNLHIMDLYL